MAKTVLKNPGRSMDFGENLGNVFASGSHKAALSSLPEVINFYHTGKGLYLGRNVYFKSLRSFMPII